jgi:hypothetical protein
MSPPLPAPPALKRARPDSQPLAPTTSQATLQADGASAEPLEAHDATERNTKKPRLQNAEAAPILHDLPEDWDLKSRRAKKNLAAVE